MRRWRDAPAGLCLSGQDELLRDVERAIGKTAKHHDAHTLSLPQTVPGVGKILRLVLLYDTPQT